LGRLGHFEFQVSCQGEGYPGFVGGFYRVAGFDRLFTFQELFWICSFQQVKGYLKGYIFIG
jgi:hypothetical protein